MNQVLSETEKRMQDILAQRDQATTAYEKKAAESRFNVSKAEEDMAAAAKSEDVQAYQRAKALLLDAQASAELFEGKLHALEAAPLIDQTEYEGTVKVIMAAIQAEDDAARTKLERLTQQMQQTGQRLQDVIDYGNSLLHRLQHDVFKDSATVLNCTGRKVHLDSLEKRYRNYNTTWWAGEAARINPYKDKKGWNER